MSAIDILIRPAEARDARAIAEIYYEAIESTTSTFDTEPKTEALLRDRTTPIVCVLGDPAFYCRFGFEPADRFGVSSEFGGATDGAFQIVWLVDRPHGSQQARAEYLPEFAELA